MNSLCLIWAAVQALGFDALSIGPEKWALPESPRVARGAAIGAVEAFWLALIAALVAWGLSPSANPSGDPTASSPGCVSVGKGGMICDGFTAAVRKVATENADPCLSLGRGGRYCPSAK